ncbi:hypothetical protein M1116_04100 [Patescibacteria group bacterium]|nr:hypothetical protein [Patescibacteria group bacterium]
MNKEVFVILIVFTVLATAVNQYLLHRPPRAPVPAVSPGTLQNVKGVEDVVTVTPLPSASPSASSSGKSTCTLTVNGRTQTATGSSCHLEQKTQSRQNGLDIRTSVDSSASTGNNSINSFDGQ